MLAKRRLPTLPSEVGDDKTASDFSSEEQLVQGPYRDAGDSKLNRKRAIERWLLTLAEAESKRAAVLREHALLEQSMEIERREFLERIHQTTACKQPWEAMKGSPSRRVCGRCNHDVYDLAEMPRAEVEALFLSEAEFPCVRLRLRQDGRVTTSSCPAEPSRIPTMRSVMSRAASEVAIAVSAAAMGGAVAMMCMDTGAPTCRVDRAEEQRALEREFQQALEEATEARAEESRSLAPQESAAPMEHAGLAPHVDDTATLAQTNVIPAAPVGLESERIGHNEYVVSRSFVERMTQARQHELRAVPHEQNGVAFGVRIFGLRRRGEFEQLGLRNGDVVLRMNGISVSAPSALPELASSFQGSTHLVVDVLRAGRVTTMRYTVLG